MVSKKLFILPVLYLFFAGSLYAQQYNLNVYSVNKGLPQAQVHDITQTQDGHIWMVTYGGGLVKFDGTTFTNYTKKDGLKDNLAEKLLVDSNDNIWVSTDDGGVAKFQGDSLVYPIKNDSLAKYSVSALQEMDDGSLWIGTYQGGVFIRQDKKIKRLTVSDGLVNNSIWDFLEAKDGKIWMGTANGVSVYDGSSFKSYVNELPGEGVYKILETSDGKIWVGTSEGFSIWDGKNFQTTRSIGGEALGSIYDILEASNGKIWIATRSQGIYIYDDGQFDHITEKNGLSSNMTYDLFEDRNNQIWIGTDEDGVNLYRGDGFLFYNKDTGMASNEILSVHQDRKGIYWFGTKDGIESFDGTTFKSHLLPEKYEDLNIWHIVGLPNGNKLIGTPERLMEFDGQRVTNFSQEYNLGDLYIYDLMVDSSDALWIGAYSGLYKVDLESREVKHFTTDDGLANEQVFHVYEDDEGRKWVGTYYGLSLFDGQNFKTFRIQDGLVHNQVNYITQDEHGDIWIGTRGGISVLKSIKDNTPSEIDNFDKNDGLILLNTHFLWFDQNGFLWQGTNGGLYKYDVPSYRESGQMPITHYALSNEGIGLEFNFHALTSEAKQEVWMGSMGGVVRLRPNELEDIPLMDLNITDIRANTKPVNWGDFSDSLEYHNGALNFPSVTFPSDKNIFEFIFQGISFPGSENVKYRYKLEGHNDDWMPVTENNSAVFTNLRPGNYTFIVQAKQSGGNFADNQTTYSFFIDFPFWQSYWFYAIILTSVIGIIYGYIRLRINQLEKKQLQDRVDEQTKHLTEALEEKEVLIKEIHHRVKNNLAVISGLLELQMGHAQNDFVSRVLSESQRRVQSISMIHEKLYQNEHLAEIDFEKYVKELVDIVAYSFSNPDKNISVDIDIADCKLGVDQGIPCGLILNEILSNAYEHAFKNQKEGSITIQVYEKNDDKIVLKVSDNGQGFAEDFDISSDETLGLTLVKTLCKQLQGEFQFSNTISGAQFVLEFKRENPPLKVPT